MGRSEGKLRALATVLRDQVRGVKSLNEETKIKERATLTVFCSSRKLRNILASLKELFRHLESRDTFLTGFQS